VNEADAIVYTEVDLTLSGRVILDQVSLSVPRGKTTVLMGPSGAGKTTLINLALGLLRPNAGKVQALGEDLATLNAAQMLALRKRFGMLFQDSALFGSLSVGDNVGFPLRHHLHLKGSELSDRVEHLLGLVGLSGFSDRAPDALSGGQQKRVALARAIAMEPEVVLFDEPTSGLDPMTSAAIDALVNDMQQRLGITFMVITHDVQSAHAIAHHAGLLFDGKIRAYGTRDEVWASADPVTRSFLDRRQLAEVASVK
jgi:phospholipid/cholesterol/gamma-HCH transport system ATP-binding protein